MLYPPIRVARTVLLTALLMFLANGSGLFGQSFTQSNLQFNGMGDIAQGTSLMFGPDGRLYVIEYSGALKIYTIQRNGIDDYEVVAAETLLDVKNIPNHNDDGTAHSGPNREATGIAVAGTPTNPVIYVSSSDFRIGGPGGDVDLDTNSGVITRMTWNGTAWETVDIVRGLSRSEENHATNGLEFVTIGGTDYLLVCSGGHTNAGSPSDNFAWTTEYALSAALLSVNLTQLEAMPILTDASGREYIYDIPTLDDPTRPNLNGVTDPDDPAYNGIDVNDPWGGNDGLNQAMIVPGGPVQIFSAGYRNSFDLVVTADGKVYCTDNGANGGWGGLPFNEGSGSVTNEYDPSEPGSTAPVGGEIVNNQDHLSLITTDIQNYSFGGFYGGHPSPVRANPTGAGLYTNPTANATTNAVFRTLIYDPDGSRGAGYTTDASIALPANWPPVPISQADARQGDWRGPGVSNPDGPDDVLVTVWPTNTNGIDEYTASNFGGAMQGDLIAGKNGGVLRRVELNAAGTLETLTPTFISGLGGNALGITCNSDDDPFPGTIWVATFNGAIKVLEPQDLVQCILPGETGYSPTADNDNDGYSNQDEIDNQLPSQSVEDIICNGGNQPNDFDKSAGAPLVSDLNDSDDDNDGIPDANDPFQLGDPTVGGSDAFNIPVINDLLSDNPELKGYLGLGFTGLMNNGAANPNYLNWLDRRDDPNDPNPNDILGGAVGAMTMHMTAGTALAGTNTQEKAFQYGVKMDNTAGTVTVEGRLFNFTAPLQLFHPGSPQNGELGLFIGDGTQADYIKFVLKANGQLQGLMESADIPRSQFLANVTAGNEIVLSFSIDAAAGTVTLSYTVQGGTESTLGTFTAMGNLLTAIQSNSVDLAVGLIGSSNSAGEEVEGTWDYLYVQSPRPFIEDQLPDVEVLVDAADETFNLDDYFGDDNGDANLTYTVTGNTGANVGAGINGNQLTVTIPSTTETADVTVRATDGDGLFIEQTFTVDVSDEPEPVLRVRANGPTIAATDAPNPDWVGGIGAGAQTGMSNGFNFSVGSGNLTGHDIMGRDASVPAYVPQTIYALERWDAPAAPAMEWTFDLPNDNYFVRLYLGNGWAGTATAGTRVFDILIEEQVVQDDLDLITTFGHEVGGMLEFPVTLTDGTLNISFGHVTENPLINGIEILTVGGISFPPIVIDPILNQSHEEGEIVNLTIMANGGNANENFTYSATGLPPGLQVEPTTGLIFGTVATGAAAGSVYTTVVTVTKPGSGPASQSLSWTIGLPQVNTQWNDQTDVENYTARHECSFVQAGDKFYLFGGRENPTTLDVYDYQSKSWSSITNSAPAEFNHFQAVEYQGLIWVIGAFQDNDFSNGETPADHVWAYNPATDEWIQGPEIPAGRKRGSAGLVMYNDKFYVIAGNTNGHKGGYQAWFDEFDPATGTWTVLPDAPRARDHFHAALVGDKIYVAGGRLSGGPGGVFNPLIAEVDVYDLTTGTWSTAPDLPTPRAAASVALFNGELYVIGGEIENDLNGNPVNDAVKTTEAFNPGANAWAPKSDLLVERHGTQAIVSGNGIHVTAGSNTKGGSGNMKNMEFFGTDNPTGTPLTAGQLQTPASVSVTQGATNMVTVAVTGGNTGKIITGATITGSNAASFTLNTPVSFALIKPGSSLDLEVGYTGSQPGETATLEIAYDDGNTATVGLNGVAILSGAVVYRVNAGGPLVTATGADPTDWSADQSVAGTGGTATTGTPSPYYNVTPPATDLTFGAAFTGTNNTGYPDALFATERYSTAPNPDNMQWDFPVPNGDYTVNLLFAEVWTGATTPGTRVFDVEIEGMLVIDDLDQTVAYGHNTAGVQTFVVNVSDGNLDIDFIKGPQNPNIKGIEIISNAAPNPGAPVVTNPGSQFGVEGDNVSLQITATDDDACTGLTYSATGLPPGLSINPATGLISGTLQESTGSGVAGAFIEQNGVVVIEMESAGTLPGSWKDISTYNTAFSTDVNNPGGASGGNFIIWEGPQSLGTPGNGLMTFPVEITTTGVYKFQWRNQVGKGTITADHNDTWLKIEGDAFYGEKGSEPNVSRVCPNGFNANENDCISTTTLMGSSSNGWFKIYSSGANNWSWGTATSDNDAHQIFARFDSPGTYNILVSARSSSHAVDRMVLSHVSAFSGNPQSLSLPESNRNPGGVAGAAANSPYNVVVTVSDGCSPQNSTSVAFPWNVFDGNSSGSLTLTATSQGRGNDHSGVHSVELYATSDLSVPAYTYSPTATAGGQMTVAGFAPGTYKVVVKRANYLQRVIDLNLTTGNSTASMAELKGGDLNGDNLVTLPDISLLVNQFNTATTSTDINGDGLTTLPDISILVSNFNTSGETLNSN